MDEGSSPKKSRRAVGKRMVTMPVGGEAAPSTDTWAWRKYGQKPIKGSPYPRGYYRCSSWKGCTARKQVERSRVDPTMLVVTYSSDHNHPGPISSHRNYRAEPPLKPKVSASDPDRDPVPADADWEPKEVDLEGRFVDLIGGDQGEFRWFSDVGSPSTSASPTGGSDDTLLYGSMAGCGVAAMLWTEETERDGEDEEEEVEDSLFAGLEELPECSVVFRRRIMAAVETK